MPTFLWGMVVGIVVCIVLSIISKNRNNGEE